MLTEPQSYIFSCNTHVASDTGDISIGGILCKNATWLPARSFSLPGVCRFRSRIGTRDDTPHFRLAMDTHKIFRSRTFNLYHFPFQTLYDAIGGEKREKIRLICALYYGFFLACTDPTGSPFHSTPSDVRVRYKLLSHSRYYLYFLRSF